MLAPWKKSYDKRRQHIKKQRCHFVDKGPYSLTSTAREPIETLELVRVHRVKALVFPVVMYGCESWDYKES